MIGVRSFSIIEKNLNCFLKLLNDNMLYCFKLSYFSAKIRVIDLNQKCSLGTIYG